MSNTLGLKNVNMLSKEQYDGVAEPAQDELYAISGSGFGFPSSNYEELELGASGTQYTAPANGYVSICKISGTTDAYITIDTLNITSGVICQLPYADNSLKAFMPLRKGQQFRVYYTATGTTNYFRFIYAEGE